jgi:hypothetical protein
MRGSLSLRLREWVLRRRWLRLLRFCWVLKARMLRDRFMVEMGVGTVKDKGKNQLQVNFGLGSCKGYMRLMRCSMSYLSYSASTIP